MIYTFADDDGALPPPSLGSCKSGKGLERLGRVALGSDVVALAAGGGSKTNFGSFLLGFCIRTPKELKFLIQVFLLQIWKKEEEEEGFREFFSIFLFLF